MDPTIYYMKVFIFESLQESTVAVLRAFAPTAKSPVMGVGMGAVHAYLWTYMRGRVHEGAWMCALGCVPCACMCHLGGRPRCRDPSPHGRLIGDAPYFPPLCRAFPGGGSRLRKLPLWILGCASSYVLIQFL